MTAKEESTLCSRACCANSRSFTMRVTDDAETEILRFERPLRCMYVSCMCCYPDWTQVLRIYSGDTYLGRIAEHPSCCFVHPKLEVIDANDEKLFMIHGPVCGCICCSNVDFPVWKMPPEDFRKVQLYFSYYKQVTDLRDGSDVGNIEWQWRGCKKSLLTDSDVWTMELSPHMDVEKKALMLGGLMLAVSFVLTPLQ